MRKLIAILVASAMVCAFAPLVGAATSDTIVVTLTPSGTADINVYAENAVVHTAPATWGPGVAIGSHTATATDHAFNITNEGTFPVAVDVYVSNDGDAWNITAAPGHNEYNMSWTLKDSGAYTLLTKTSTDDFTTLGYASTKQFGLQVYMPTSSSTVTAQTVTITFVATIG